jgi:hypothetical protein
MECIVCPICSKGIEDKIYITTCLHKFHEKCIGQLAAVYQKGFALSNLNCPICQQSEPFLGEIIYKPFTPVLPENMIYYHHYLIETANTISAARFLRYKQHDSYTECEFEYSNKPGITTITHYSTDCYFYTLGLNV